MPSPENSKYAKNQSLIEEDFNYRKRHVRFSFTELYKKMAFHNMTAQDFYNKSVIFINKICNISNNSLKFIHNIYDCLEAEEKIKSAFKQDHQLAISSYTIDLLRTIDTNLETLNVSEDQLLLNDSKQEREKAALSVWGCRIIDRPPGEYSAEDVSSWIDNIAKVIISGNYIPTDGSLIGVRKNDIEQYCANEFEGKSFSDILLEGLRRQIGLTEDKKQEQERPVVSNKRKSSSLESGTSSSMSSSAIDPSTSNPEGETSAEDGPIRKKPKTDVIPSGQLPENIANSNESASENKARG